MRKMKDNALQKEMKKKHNSRKLGRKAWKNLAQK